MKNKFRTLRTKNAALVGKKTNEQEKMKESAEKGKLLFIKSRRRFLKEKELKRYIEKSLSNQKKLEQNEDDSGIEMNNTQMLNEVTCIYGIKQYQQNAKKILSHKKLQKKRVKKASSLENPIVPANSSEKSRFKYLQSNISKRKRHTSNTIEHNQNQASSQYHGKLAFSMKKQKNTSQSLADKAKRFLKEKFFRGKNKANSILKIAGLYVLGLMGVIAVPVLLIVALVYNSPFALFLPSVDSDKTIFTVTTAYTSDFNQEINALVENPSPADTAKIIYTNYEGDALAPSNYYDIIAVYMVQYGIGNMATIMDETAERNLKKVFDDMCSYTIKKKTEKPEEGSEHPQEQILIYVTLKDYRDMIKKYEFTQEQIELVETIMSPQYLALLGGITEEPDNSNSGSSQMQDLINHVTDMEIKTVLNFALSKLGYPYSQQYRDSGKYYDCSSLTYYAWRSVGVDLLYEGSNTAAQQAKLCNDKGYTVSYSNIQPGDLIFYRFGHNGRYKNISHVAMYVGDGMLVDASYSKQKVVFRNVYSRENIVLIGRPRGK